MKLVSEVLYGICILQVKNGDIRFLKGDKKFAEILGYAPEEIKADSFAVQQIISPKIRRQLVQIIAEQLKEKSVACVEVELLGKNFKSINAICCLNQYYDVDTREEYIRAVIQDVTQERMNHLQMQSKIEQDSLTKLYNKETIERITNNILEADYLHQHAFFVIDIDNFKGINDTFGHVFGDTVIQDLAASIRKAFPEKAKVGRIGGDEFVVFLPNTEEEEIQKSARRVIKNIRREFVSDMDLVQISCSVGITQWQSGELYQDMMKKADVAMYFAKDSGKNRSAVFEESMVSALQNQKLKAENKKRGKYIEQIYDVEFVFLAYQLLTDSRQFESSMNFLLERTVERFGIDRVSVFEAPKQEEFLERINSGVNTKIFRMGEEERYIERKWLERHVDDQGELVVNEVIPGQNIPTLNNYMAIPKSFVTCSIKEGDTINGCVTFSQYQKKRVWTPYEIKTFHELTKAIAISLSLRKDRRRNQEEIHRLTTRDKVTGLLDQKNFEQQLGEYIRHCREFSCLALVYLDVNNFSYVNERYGTNAGDELLSSLAKMLKSNSNMVLAGRMVSDCFLGLYTCENKENAIKMISEGHEKMLTVLRKKYPIASLQFKCGIYFLENEMCTVNEAVENANMARKSIKEDGRTNYCIYSEELREVRSKEQTIIVEFLECIKNNSLELYLQPSFRIDTRELKEVEAFGHWYNNHGEERRPKDIVPVLKKHGYILEWDMAVYKEVLKLMRSWKEKGAELPMMEVNFSTADFQYSGIVKELVELAQQYEISPELLVIAMSEHGWRKAPKKVNYVLKELQKNGFKIAIGNFGSNYEAVEMLVDETIDVIKIGRNLLHSGKEHLRSEYLRYIRKIVHSASKELIFVGAENEQQEQEIRECGYDVVQGYLYERELPAQVFEEQYIKVK